jgi:hypothetical protein
MRVRLFSACLLTVCLMTRMTTAAQQPSSGGRGFVVAEGRGMVVGGQVVADPGGQLMVDAFALESVDVGAAVKGAPYSAEATTEVIQPLVDGNRIVRRTGASLYRDSRGRTRREVTLEEIAGIMVAGAPLRMITISDPDSGMTYFVDSDKQLRVLRNAPDPARAATGAAPRPPLGPRGGARPLQSANLEREEALGTREIEGIVAEGTRTTVTIPAGAIGNERAIESVSERWFSPALRIVVLSRRSDPRFGETTYRLTKISRAEPPAALFERPGR